MIDNNPLMIKKMKNNIDFLNDDIYEIDTNLEKMNLNNPNINSLINKIMNLEYDFNNALYETEELLDSGYTEDDIDEMIEDLGNEIEDTRKELETLIKL